MSDTNDPVLPSANTDESPALHNCGPSPSSVYRTAPVGKVYVLDLYREVQQGRLLYPLYRKDFVTQTAKTQAHGHALDSDVNVQATPAMIVHAAGTVLSQLPRRGGVIPFLKLTSRSGTTTRKKGEKPPPFTEVDALEAIRQLTRHLQKMDLLVPVHGLVSWMPRYSGSNPPLAHARIGEPLPWLPSHGDEYAAAIRFAWMLCVYSFAAPPLVLFNREPSFRYLRADGALQIRWLGQEQVGA